MSATAASNPYIRTCSRCGLQYDWRRSPSSSLKMTFCGSLCERAALGFTIEALLRYEAPLRVDRPAPQETVASRDEERDLVTV